MASRNINYVATRKVKLKHIGRKEFTNWGGWGKWDTDELAHAIAARRTAEQVHND